MTTIQIDDDGIGAYANPRRTGVIVGVNQNVTAQQATEFAGHLRTIFPEVTIAVVPGANSVTFEWDQR